MRIISVAHGERMMMIDVLRPLLCTRQAKWAGMEKGKVALISVQWKYRAKRINWFYEKFKLTPRPKENNWPVLEYKKGWMDG